MCPVRQEGCLRHLGLGFGGLELGEWRVGTNMLRWFSWIPQGLGLCKACGASEAKGAGIPGRFPGQLEVVMVASFIKTGDNGG